MKCKKKQTLQEQIEEAMEENTNFDNIAKKSTTPHDTNIECPHCNKTIDFDALLNKYGPEGLYEIADKLKEIADKDVQDALLSSQPLPTTLSEAVDYFIPAFKGMEEDFKRSEDSFAGFCHSQLSGGIGMQIRNTLDLWNDKSTMHNHMKNVQKVAHPEDMSDKILREIYKKVKASNPNI